MTPTLLLWHSLDPVGLRRKGEEFDFGAAYCLSSQAIDKSMAIEIAYDLELCCAERMR